MFNGVRFFRASRGKTAHKAIGTYHAAAGKTTLCDAEERNCVSPILIVIRFCARQLQKRMTKESKPCPERAEALNGNVI